MTDPSPPFASGWLPAADFPVVLRLVDVDTGRIVWQHTLSGPGRVRVPGLRQTGARAVRAEAQFPDGRVIRDGEADT